jgi:hypothetical protein
MKTVLAAMLALAFGGCLSVPMTPTAYNDDACLKETVRGGPPLANSARNAIPLSSPPECKSMRDTWGQTRTVYPGPHFGAGGGEITTN